MRQNLILVTMSPIAKIFMKRFRVMDAEGNESTVYPEQLLDEPERIFREEKFCVPFPTVRGNINFWCGVPLPIQDQTHRDILVGGRSGFDGQETDWTGLVMLDVEMDVLSGIFQVMAGGKMPAIEKQIKTAMKDARAESDKRCMDAARRIYRRMESQMQMIEEDGKGKFSPSVTERLVALVMEKEAIREVQRKTAHDEAFSATMARIKSAGATNAANNSI